MSEVLRLLQVEDSESDAALISRLLVKAGYDVRSHRVENAGDMSAALSGREWDVILADYRMPGFDAPAALAVLHETGRDIPFIVVSATIGEDRAVAMMKSGAHDYVLKDNLARLVPAVEREIGEARLRHERRRLERQLLQSQKLEGIGRLAGGIAHDFNNLLTVITGYSDLVLRQLLPEHSLREPIVEISKAASRASDLTRQLLAFSRRQGGEAKIIELNQVVADFEKMLRRLIGEDIELVLSLQPDVTTMRADPGHIEQLIMNLSVNAKDAMPGGGRLSIATSRVEAGHAFAEPGLSADCDLLMLSVSDTGAGMSDEVKAHIFEPFFTTKEQGKGTGLGLSTVYGIVKQNHGSIWVDSGVGRGTTFRMLFPVESADSRPVVSPVTAKLQYGDETVLVAEDDPAVRKYIRETLNLQGYRVLEAANGGEALETARQHPGAIHLLLTDSVMPGMSGPELAAEFSMVRPGVPFVIASGYSDQISPEIRKTSNYLQKPFTPAMLLAHVRSALEAHPPSPLLVRRIPE